MEEKFKNEKFLKSVVIQIKSKVVVEIEIYLSENHCKHI